MHNGSNEQWSASRCTTTHTVKQRIHQNYSHLCQYTVTLLLCYDLLMIKRCFRYLIRRYFDSLDKKKIISVQKVTKHFVSIFGFVLSKTCYDWNQCQVMDYIFLSTVLFETNTPLYHHLYGVEIVFIFILFQKDYYVSYFHPSIVLLSTFSTQ